MSIGAKAHVAVALVRALGIAVQQPNTEFRLECSNGLIMRGGLRLHEELLQHGAMEPLDEAVGLWRMHTGAVMFNIIECHVHLVRVVVGATKLAPIVG